MDNNKDSKLLLHVHGQYQQHDTVQVVGTREALIALQKALNKAISSPAEHYETMVHGLTTKDGEDYDIEVSMLPEASIETDDELPYNIDIWDGESV